MRMKKQNNFVIHFLRNSGHPELVEKWCSNENQEQFHKIRFDYENREKRRCTSFFLFCNDRRPELREQYPYYPPTSISKLLGEEWRKHRDANDDVYEKYTTQDLKQVFCKKQTLEIQRKYAHFTPEVVQNIVEKMFEKYIIAKKASENASENASEMES